MMNYKNIFLDCDGVILDSNQLKTNVFRQILKDYPLEQVEQIVSYHQRYGGISRFKKIEYFLKEIASDYTKHNYERLVNEFADICRVELTKTTLTNGVESFIKKFSSDSNLYILSGGAQDELQLEFTRRKLNVYFKDILGSPVSKLEHLKRLKQSNDLSHPALFVGDSAIDHQAAQAFNLDFIFLTGYTDLENWQNYCDQHNIEHYRDFKQLMDKKHTK